MSKKQRHASVQWSRKAPVRLAGYLAPFMAFVGAVLWLNPQNTIGWVATAIPTIAALLLITAPVFTQARSEIVRKADSRQDYAKPSFLNWQPTMRFNDPSGEVSMESWLERQP